jgi:hypothetical protein
MNLQFLLLKALVIGECLNSFFSPFGLPLYNEDIIVLDRKVTEFVAKHVFMVVARNRMIGVIAEIESLVNEFLFCYRGFFTLQYLFKDPPVPSQRIIDVPHIIGGVAVLLVVISVAAHIAAELFIDPAPDWFPAFGALPFFHGLIV